MIRRSLFATGRQVHTRLLATLVTLGSAAGIGSSATAQVVQLPSVSNFSTSGAVVVPDGGTAVLGGSGYSATSTRSASGVPLNNRAFSGSTGMAGSSVSATIIDLQAMDAALLEQAQQQRKLSQSPYHGPPRGNPIMNTLRQEAPPTTGKSVLYKPPGRAPFDSPGAAGPGVLPPDYLGGSGALHDETEVRFFMERAQQAQSLGRHASARVYYQMAWERMTPAQRARLAEFRRKQDEIAEALAAGKLPPKDDATGTQATSAPSAAAPAAPSATPAAPANPPAGDNSDPFSMN